MKCMRSQRMRWFGYVSRMSPERFPKYIMHWTPKHGKRTRGIPTVSLMETYRSDGDIRTGFNDITVDN